MSKKTVFRVAKNRDNPYVMLSKKFLEHPELSYRAKGILSYILSKPDHWKLSVSDLVKHGKEGRDAIYSTLKELIRLGFMQHVCYRENGKISHYEYIVYEEPHQTAVESITYTSITAPSKEDTPSQPLHPKIPEADSSDGVGVQSPSPLPEVPDEPQSVATPADTLLPENPVAEKTTLSINDFRKELKNKTCSSRACGIVQELWQDIFGDDLQEWEYNALLKTCSRTALVKTLCLIHEHHKVNTIQSPFAFVMSCATGGGYKVPKRQVTTTSYGQKRPPTQRVHSGEKKHAEKKPSPEELAKVKAQIEKKVRELYGHEPNGERA